MKKVFQNILASFAVIAVFTPAAMVHAKVSAPHGSGDAVIYVRHFENTLIINQIDTPNQVSVKFVQQKISPAKAKVIARSRVKGGEVVDVSLKNNTYRVRVISKSGRVVDVLIDANTGRVK